MISNAIKKIRKSANLTQKDLAMELNVSQQTIASWETGRTQPSVDFVIKLAKVFNCDTTDLFEPETKKSPDTMSEDNQTNKFLNALKNNPDIFPVVPTRKVPILGSIACGTPILAQENIEGYLEVEVRSNVTFALRCKGDSMAPKLLDEDVVLIHRQPVVENGETAAVLIGEEATLKRVYVRENSIILAPENLNYEPIHLTGEEMSNVSILGKVVGYVRYF